MAISVLGTVAAPRVSGGAGAVAGTACAASRRLPMAIVAAGSIGILEAIGLLAVALTGLDAALSAITATPWPIGPWLIAPGLVVVAGWIVVCAGSGAALVDGAGRTLLRGVAFAELALVAALLVLATVLPFENPTALPVPALGLLVLAVPVGKLLLAGAPSAQRWVAEGPRVRSRRPDPVRAHRLLAAVTLGLIGASLCALAVLAPVPAADAGATASAVEP